MRSVFAKMGNAATSKKGDSAENGKERLRCPCPGCVIFSSPNRSSHRSGLSCSRWTRIVIAYLWKRSVETSFYTTMIFHCCTVRRRRHRRRRYRRRRAVRLSSLSTRFVRLPPSWAFDVKSAASSRAACRQARVPNFTASFVRSHLSASVSGGSGNLNRPDMTPSLPNECTNYAEGFSIPWADIEFGHFTL